MIRFSILLMALMISLSACDQMQNGSNGSDMSSWLDIGKDSSAISQSNGVDLLSVPTESEKITEPPTIPIGDALKGTYCVVVRSSTNGEVFGSGFLLKENQIVTNYHVIENFMDGFVRTNDKGPRYKINEILKVDRKNDIAILRVESIQEPFVLPISNTLPAIGERIYALGCPKGLEGTISSGIISQFRESDGRGTCNNPADASFYQTDVQINRGSSGGPIVNEKGQVIAIAVSGYGDGLNFLIPMKFIEVLNTSTY